MRDFEARGSVWGLISFSFLPPQPISTMAEVNMVSHAAVTGKRRDHIFYLALAIVAAAIVFVGFVRTYYLRDLFGGPPLPPLVHLHGALFTAWLVLLLSQITLVAARRTHIHRRLGVAGVALAAFMIVVGTITAIHAARRGVTPPGGPPPLVFLVIPLGDLLMFSILVAAGFYYRRQSETHKRLMLLATIAILAPAIARLPFAFILANGPLAFFGLTDLVLLACIFYDIVSRRGLHPAYLWGGLLLVTSQPLRLAVGSTQAWLAFANSLTR
jgi:hypothetical protein